MGGATSWDTTPLNVAGIGALDCPTVSYCVAGDGSGDLLVSNSPAAGRQAWKVADTDEGHWIASVDCSGMSLCMASDNAGNVLTNVPGSAAWSANNVDGVAVIWTFPARPRACV